MVIGARWKTGDPAFWGRLPVVVVSVRDGRVLVEWALQPSERSWVLAPFLRERRADEMEARLSCRDGAHRYVKSGDDWWCLLCLSRKATIERLAHDSLDG